MRQLEQVFDPRPGNSRHGRLMIRFLSGLRGRLAKLAPLIMAVKFPAVGPGARA